MCSATQHRSRTVGKTKKTRWPCHKSYIYIYIYINKKKHLPMGPPLGHRKIILFIYVYIYIYIRNQPIYKHNGTKRAQNKNGVSSPLTPNDIFCIFLLVLQQSPVDLGVFFCRSVGRSVGLGTWAQEHQSNVHCFFYLIRCVLMCTNVY